MTAQILIHRLHPAAVVPKRAHPGDAGLDLCSIEEVELEPGERGAVGTGLALALPAGFVALVHPRSGLALRAGITVVNSPGTIDAGYRGELRVLLVNLGQEPWRCQPGECIAQLVIMELPPVAVVEVSALPGTHRGAAGFGSTDSAPSIG